MMQRDDLIAERAVRDHRRLYSWNETSRARHKCRWRQGCLWITDCPVCCPHTYALAFSKHRRRR